MPESIGRTFTHGTFDRAIAEQALSDPDARQVLSAAFTLLGTCIFASPTSQDGSSALEAVRQSATDWPFGDRARVSSAAALLTTAASGNETSSAKGSNGAAPDSTAPVPQTPASDVLSASEDAHELQRDWQRMFRGPGHLEAAPWGSVYMDHDQVMYGWTWVCLRDWMRKNGIEATYPENDPEDSFGRLLCLAGEITLQAPAKLPELLADHVLCWSPRFLETMVAAARTRTYKGIGMLCSATLDDVQDMLAITPAQRRMYR